MVHIDSSLLQLSCLSVSPLNQWKSLRHARSGGARPLPRSITTTPLYYLSLTSSHLSFPDSVSISVAFVAISHLRPHLLRYVTKTRGEVPIAQSRDGRVIAKDIMMLIQKQESMVVVVMLRVFELNWKIREDEDLKYVNAVTVIQIDE
ncbi:unnamed protein product [Vicia faba]|uniref:Uncharacterized protein n=1 Tax=Vicia faba TaxID=3906 RepID=A0AAV0ZY94_VICFA|nr:unnamed protein product [Vicia faba]